MKTIAAVLFTSLVMAMVLATYTYAWGLDVGARQATEAIALAESYRGALIHSLAVCEPAVSVLQARDADLVRQLGESQMWEVDR